MSWINSRLSSIWEKRDKKLLSDLTKKHGTGYALTKAIIRLDSKGYSERYIDGIYSLLHGGYVSLKTIGTGVSKHSIVVDGIECLPYGDYVVIDNKDYKGYSKNDLYNWKIISDPESTKNIKAIPPKDKYLCLWHENGTPAVEGHQCLLYESE